MIINDTSKLPIDWMNRFNHRDCDPDGYSVGIFPELSGKKYIPTTLVLNMKTKCVMEYFYDDIENFKEIIPTYRGLNNNYKLYKIVNGYRLININTNQKRDLVSNSSSSKFRSEYPIIKCTISKKSYNIPIHLIMANTFVPNPYPEKFKIVNHKNKNKFDFSIENLEFCDYYWNSLAINQSVAVIKHHKKDTLNDYMSRHPLKNNIWYDHPTIKNLSANSAGILKTSRGMTVGTFSKKQLIYKFLKYQVHRLVVECIIGRLLDETEVIDHIIPVSVNDVNNEFSNLKICTTKENMNNEKTVLKLTKVCYSCNYLGEDILKHESIVKTLNHSTKLSLSNYGRLYYMSEEEKQKKLSYIYYKFSESGECVDSNINFSKITQGLSKYVRDKYRKYINSGLISPDGFYYQQGSYPNIIKSENGESLVDKYPLKLWSKIV